MPLQSHFRGDHGTVLKLWYNQLFNPWSTNRNPVISETIPLGRLSPLGLAPIYNLHPCQDSHLSEQVGLYVRRDAEPSEDVRA